MIGKFLFLGTAASAGIPIIGCKCSVCISTSPYNRRLRSAGALRLGSQTILIDVGPDFRQQALKYGIDAPDGLLLTHTHYDHIAGVDDLRIFYVRTKKPFPCLLSNESHEEMKKRYYYLFEKGASLSAQLDLHILKGDQGTVEFLGHKIGYMSYVQSGMKVNGFRIGDFAYVSDIKEYDDSIFETLKGVRKLVLSALHFESSTFHLTIDEAVAFAKRVGAEETRLTHLSHAVDHEETNRKLPSNIQLGRDGLEMEFQC